MDKDHQSKGFSDSGGVALATAIVLLSGWSANASGAATTEIECDTMVRDIRTLDVPMETLSAHPVDHVTIDAGQPEDSLLDASSATSETAAPFLYLTPRVASVLRDVFEASQPVDATEKTIGVSSSPVAEFDGVFDVSKILDESDPEPLVEDEIRLPQFQQQMFRTDI